MRDEVRSDDVREETADHGQDANSNLAEASAGQGRYVVPFTMTREEEALGMELARSQLTQLVSECAAPSDAQPSLWTRVKTRKKSTGVILWEKRSQQFKRELSRRKKWRSRRGDSGSSESGAQLNTPEAQGPTMYSIRSSTTVNASLDTVLKTLDASVTTAHSSPIATNYSTKTEADAIESLAVRWFVCRTNNPMASDGDFCLQEYTKRYSIDELAANGDQYNNNRHQDGNYNLIDGLHPADEVPVAYKLFRSVETRHCPELQASHRLVRCKVPLGGFLFYPTDSIDKTDVVFSMSIAHQPPGDRGGRSLSMQTQCSERQFRALQQVVRQMALQIERLNNAAESYQMGLYLESLRASRWVRNVERAQCAVCYRRFHHITRRRHHCRLCGEVICRDCSVHKDVDLPTFGPTALRVCTPCDRIHAQMRPQAPFALSESEVSAASENLRKRRARHRAESNKQEEKSTSRKLTASRTAENTASVKNEKITDRKLTGLEIAHRQEQVNSVLKPLASPVIHRRYFMNKLSGNRMAALKSPVVATAPSTPTSPPIPFGINQSISMSAPCSPHMDTYSQRESNANLEHLQEHRAAVKLLPKNWQQLKDAYNEDEEKVESPETNIDDASATESGEPRWLQIRSPSAAVDPFVYAVTNGILAEDNQKPASRSSLKSNGNRPLIRRSVKTSELYEEILVKLCGEVEAIQSAKFVAITLFTNRDGKNQSEEAEAVETAVHYLKVKANSKLMKVAANMRCCDPVLQLQKAVITRNTWKVVDNSSVHPSGYEFRQLPIVFGPQQARFYAGVPLVNTKRQYTYGALAVFDPAINPGKDDDSALCSLLDDLQKFASAAVTALDDKRKEVELESFLQAPLLQLRKSESALPQLSRGSRHWKPIGLGEQESLDGDSDDEIEEAQKRLEFELSHGHRKGRTALISGSKSVGKPHSTSDNGSVSKERVEYFRNKMQELVQRAQETQTQLAENSIQIERHGIPIL